MQIRFSHIRLWLNVAAFVATGVPLDASIASAQPDPQVPTVEAAKVTPPVLTHFEPAPYPEEAQTAGIQGQVILKLTIDAEGKVSAVEVAEAAGHGFDELAAAAAKRFTFSPARRGDKAVPARILYRYDFTLKPAAAEAPTAGAKKKPPAARDGELTGFVMIAGTKTPLAGATVEVTLPDGKTRALTTDSQGRWTLTGTPGAYRVRVLSPGFQARVCCAKWRRPWRKRTTKGWCIGTSSRPT